MKTCARLKITWGIVGALLTITCQSSCSSAPNPPDVDQGFVRIADDIQERTGVLIRADLDPLRDFPKNWREAPIMGRGEPIDASELRRLLPVIRSFLNRYPRTLLRQKLSHIVLAKSLIFSGKPFGGTYHGSTIFVTSRGRRAGYSIDYLSGTLHAEFSSILLENYPEFFPHDDWRKANQPEWRYRGSGVEMLGSPGLFTVQSALLQRGFLSAYATSSMENDFNTLARWLFTRPRQLDRLATSHARLRQKAEIARGFYRALGLGPDF